MRPRTLLVSGLLVLALTGVWTIALAPRWTQRLPPGWAWEADYFGISTYPDPATGRFPVNDATGVYQRALRIVSATERPRAVTLEDAYITRNIDTGEVTWEYVLTADVNPITGEHLAADLRGQYLVFPRHVEKKPYRLRSNYLKDIPLAYQGEEAIEDLVTYRFEYTGRGEYTESYTGTAQYPGVRVDAGQEIKCADDRFTFKAWVEPRTGEILKIYEECLTGDYTYTIANGRQGAAVLRWAGTTAGDDVLIRADQIRADRTRLHWVAVYIPVGGGLIGMSLLIGAGVARYLVRTRA